MKYGKFYYISDELGELMRIVRHLEEAKHICITRDGWSFKCIIKKRPPMDWSKFERALI